MSSARHLFLNTLQQSVILSGILVLSGVCCAQEKSPSLDPKKLPKYELGVAGGVFYIPDYPGADQSHSRSLALPYFIYRGDIWRADREGGLRGRFLKSENLEGDLSFNGGFNAHSSHNDARRGMPDIDWIGEAGPRLGYSIFKNKVNRLALSLPIRMVFSADVESWKLIAHGRGFTFNPEVSFSHRFTAMTFVKASLGATWATEDLMDYFYEVKPRYATADRPAFEAKDGYMSTDYGFSLVHIIPKYSLATFAGVSWDIYSGAENRGSPLLRDRNTRNLAIGLVWSMYQSEETASGE